MKHFVYLGASHGAGLDELKADVTFVRNNDEQKVIESNEELIMSYKYGSDLVTVSEEDLVNFTYQSGPKSLTVLGFMPRAEIRRQLLLGDGAMTFQPVEDDENSATALSALAFALQGPHSIENFCQEIRLENGLEIPF